MSEDPPGDCNHPQNNKNHTKDVVDHAAPELTKTAHHLVTTLVVILYTPRILKMV